MLSSFVPLNVIYFYDICIPGIFIIIVIRFKLIVIVLLVFQWRFGLNPIKLDNNCILKKLNKRNNSDLRVGCDLRHCNKNTEIADPLLSLDTTMRTFASSDLSPSVSALNLNILKSGYATSKPTFDSK